MTACGTATYVAPEVLLATGYDSGALFFLSFFDMIQYCEVSMLSLSHTISACDIWSVGVITYVLLSATIPFDGETENHVFQKIIRAQFRFPSPYWDNISREGATNTLPHARTHSLTHISSDELYQEHFCGRPEASYDREPMPRSPMDEHR